MSKIDVICDLSNRSLSDVPDYVLQMTNLKMLYLEGNKIEVLPDELFVQLKKLVWLDLRNNKLKTIPQSIAHHACLETLLLRDNELQMLPLELGLVPNLKVLQISGNPIIFPNIALIEEGVKTICAYLRKQYESTTQPVPLPEYKNDIKCVLKEKHICPKRKSPPEIISKNIKPILKIKSFCRDSKCSLISTKKHKIPKTISKTNVYKDYPHHNSNKYLSMLPKKKTEVRIQEQHFKDLWMKKLKEIVESQDDALQTVKDIDTLKKWRKTFQQNNKKSNYDIKKEIPYGYDEDYLRLPSRRDLQREPDKCRHKKPTVKSKPPNVEKLISDMVYSLQNMEKERNLERSPRSQMEKAGRDIKKIIDLQKRLSMLKLVIASDSV